MLGSRGEVTFQRAIRTAIVLSVLLLGIILVAFSETQRLGQQVTPTNAIWYQLVAVALWVCLGASLALSVWGLARRRWQPLALAAVLSGTFSFFAILSIGWLTLIVTLGQIIVAARYSKSRRAG